MHEICHLMQHQPGITWTRGEKGDGNGYGNGIGNSRTSCVASQWRKGLLGECVLLTALEDTVAGPKSIVQVSIPSFPTDRRHRFLASETAESVGTVDLGPFPATLGAWLCVESKEDPGPGV